MDRQPEQNCKLVVLSRQQQLKSRLNVLFHSTLTIRYSDEVKLFTVHATETVDLDSSLGWADRNSTEC